MSDATKTDTAPETMNVRVVDRGTSRSYVGVWITLLTISAFCPKCGQRRGQPRPRNFCEDGEWLTCDVWDNPCGHTDMYGDLLADWRSVVDANGNWVRLPLGIAPSDELRAFAATQVPAAECRHYIAAKEAAAGTTKCERCGATDTNGRS